jgi:LysM repeat protein
LSRNFCIKALASILCIIAVLSFCKPAEAEAATQVLINYTVKSGDTLWGIAQKHSTTVADIKSLNGLTSNTIYVGQLLKVHVNMSEGVKNIEYTVQPGNTLYSLAEYFGTTVDRIKSANGLTGNTIYVGQLLRIPASYVNYIVVKGDTLWDIANRFNTTVYRIKLFSGLKTDTIYIGQVLHIPALSPKPRLTFITHTVKAGDNIWDLSIKYGIPQSELLKVNGLTLSSTLSIGQQLKIPVYSIPVMSTPGPQYGEYLDWWTEAQYVFPIGRNAVVKDFVTGKTFNIRRSIGANHADCEPLTATDTATIKSLWGGTFSWTTRAVLVLVDGRKIAASMTSMPHGVVYITNNNFGGHFDIHFKNSTRHNDGQIDPYHQAKVKAAAGK